MQTLFALEKPRTIENIKNYETKKVKKIFKIELKNFTSVDMNAVNITNKQHPEQEPIIVNASKST